jgi:hypothetical protein
MRKIYVRKLSEESKKFFKLEGLTSGRVSLETLSDFSQVVINRTSDENYKDCDIITVLPEFLVMSKYFAESLAKASKVKVNEVNEQHLLDFCDDSNTVQLKVN